MLSEANLLIAVPAKTTHVKIKPPPNRLNTCTIASGSFRAILLIRDSDNKRSQTFLHGMTQTVMPQYKNCHAVENIFAPDTYLS